MTDISDMRTSFDKNILLDFADFSANPFQQFSQWFTQARNMPEIHEPNAFILSTANSQGRVRSRTVLLKYFDESGFVYFTNYGSQKAKDIAENNQVSMLFPWYFSERQLIIEGFSEKITKAESLKYFISRPRGSQIGAWVSEQSQIINSRALLLHKAKALHQSFLNKDIPLPDFWGGYRIKPVRFEFWQGQPDRLHDRIEYSKINKNWQKQLLSP